MSIDVARDRGDLHARGRRVVWRLTIGSFDQRISWGALEEHYACPIAPRYWERMATGENGGGYEAGGQELHGRA